jgi:hypothetical protein
MNKVPAAKYDDLLMKSRLLQRLCAIHLLFFILMIFGVHKFWQPSFLKWQEMFWDIPCA